MKVVIRAWARFVVGQRWLVISLTALAMGLSFLPMKNLYYDNSNESFFIEGDPRLAEFNQLLERFGDVEYLSVGLVAPGDDSDLFTPQSLAVIDQLTRFLETRPEVTQVRSLTKYQHTYSKDGVMVTEDLFEDFTTPEQLAHAKTVILNEPMALDSLITRDLRHTRVVARTQYEVGSSDLKMSLMAALRQHIAEAGYAEQGYPLHLSGQPVFSEQFEVLSKRDQAWINPGMALLMVIILWFSFRTWVATLLPWAMIGSAILLVTGIQGLLHWPHTVVESALVPTLIIIGIGVAVHLLVGFYQARAKGLEPKAAAESAVEHLWVPVLFTALTTAAGFLALGVTELVPVRHFAGLGAIGSLVIFLLSMTLLPALLSFVKGYSPRTQAAVTSGLLARIIHWIPRFTRQHKRGLSRLGLALLAVSLALVPRIQVDSNFITYFKTSNPARADLHYFDQTYKGIQNLDFMIDSGASGGIHEPAFLQEVARLETWLESLPEAGKAISLIRVHQQISQALNYDDPAFYRLPDSREMAAQFLLLYDNTGPEEDLTDMRDFDERYLRLSLPIINMAASDTKALLDRVQQQLAREFPQLNTQITGSLVMYNAQDIYINQGMSRSFLLAMMIIGLSFIFLFRSLKYGLIALVPSIVPILMTGALLVLLGINLDLGTMIVGAMTMGIAVDDAIHVMSRYLRARRQGNNTQEAIDLAMGEAGRAVVFTSLILVTGFSLMLFGSFIPYIYTGLFAATIMALALIGDLIVLPALLFWIDGRRDTKPTQAPLLTPKEEPSP